MAIRSQSLTEFLDAQRIIEKGKKAARAASRDVGPTIRFMRQEAGLTQMFVAQNAGVTQSYLANVENGRKTPSADSLLRIIAAVSEGSADGTQDEDQEED